jgi:hypothetical protein
VFSFTLNFLPQATNMMSESDQFNGTDLESPSKRGDSIELVPDNAFGVSPDGDQWFKDDRHPNRSQNSPTAVGRRKSRKRTLEKPTRYPEQHHATNNKTPTLNPNHLTLSRVTSCQSK